MDSEVKRRIITTAIQRAGHAELRRLQLLVDEMLKKKDPNSYQTYEQLTSLITKPALDASFKTVALVACGLSRTIVSSADRIQHVAPLKELIWIREKIRSRLLIDAGESRHGAARSHRANEDDNAQIDRDFETSDIIKVWETFLGRTPHRSEIDVWKKHLDKGMTFPEFRRLVSECAEAIAYRDSIEVINGDWDGRFIQFAFELIYGRGCAPREVVHWETKLASGLMRRRDVLAIMYSDAARSLRDTHSKPPVAVSHSCRIMGTRRSVSIKDWQDKARTLEKIDKREPDNRYAHRFAIKSKPSYLVTAIASLYKAGKFIERFMDNIVSQSCFRDYCELVIVDADSPENEGEVIKRYLAKHRGINYIRLNHRIGIYDAWNVAVQAARGEYLTNVNLDDLRRHDSLELQAGVLDNLPFVDVTYQDFYYTFDPDLSFEEIAAFGFESNLPIITPSNMMDFNSPHNAPMWRKRLHDELGYFDTAFKSAGDYEFWMRCLAAGKLFYKLNDPHVAYYQNPDGISTRPGTRGVDEAKAILKMYGRKLVSENLLMPFDQFCRERLFLVQPRPDLTAEDRYSAAQRSMRNAARLLKYSAH
jgi:hypothetical protein